MLNLLSNLQDGSDGLPVTIGLAAATGLGVLAYTEVTLGVFLFFRCCFVSIHIMCDLSCRLIETLLQFLGSAAVVQLVVTKLLYVEVHIYFLSSLVQLV